jgi:hypothetical protein
MPWILEESASKQSMDTHFIPFLLFESRSLKTEEVCFLFGRYSVEISAGAPTVMTENYLSLAPPSSDKWRDNTSIKIPPFPSAFWSIHYSFITLPFDAV